MEASVQWSRIFNVNKAVNHLIPEENEEWLSCGGGGKMGPYVVTMHGYQLCMRKYIFGLWIISIVNVKKMFY